MKTDFKMEGAKEFRRSLSRIEKMTTRKSLARRVLKKVGWVFARVYRLLVHVDEGDLRESIGVGTRLTKRQRKLHKKLDPVEVFAGAGGLSQATQHEFGNINHPANPAARTAWASQKQSMFDTLIDEMTDEFAKIAKRETKRKKRSRK